MNDAFLKDIQKQIYELTSLIKILKKALQRGSSPFYSRIIFLINHISIKIAARSEVCVTIVTQYADMHIKCQLFSCNFVIFFVDFTDVKCYYD